MSKEPKDENYIVAGPRVSPHSCLATHHRNGEAQPTLIRKVQDGEPLDESAVMLHQRGDSNVYDCEPALAAGEGPAQVASEEYRSGWDRIFGGKQTIGEA